MACETHDLFYPWYFLGEFRTNIENVINDPICMDEEKRELIRLSHDFESLDTSEYEMIYTNIGAANVTDYLGIVRQMPMFIEYANVRTLVILIDRFNSIPSILRHREFTMVSHNTYSNGVIDIRIYNTFFPTWLDSKLQVFPNIHTKNNIINMQERSRDKEFVSQFYENLRMFINRSVASIYFVSTATFLNNEATENKGNINFEMFPEILLLVGTERFILLVWPYNSLFYYSWGTIKRINYTELIDMKEEKLHNTSAILGVIYQMKTVREKKHTRKFKRM